MTDVERFAQMLRESSRMVFFGGAGVSTESGIPDFRSEDGSFQALKAYGHPPEVLLSRSFFQRNPQVFFQYHKTMLAAQNSGPNAAHLALARLEELGKVSAVITQNIDGLHQMAGSKRVLELHGSMQNNYCLQCGATYSLAYLLAPDHQDEGQIPRCEACGGMVRPDVVLYEEALDEAVLRQAAEAISQADLLVVGGTSLVVYPAAGMLEYFQEGKLVLLNRTPTPYDSRADLTIRQPIGQVFREAMALLEPQGE